MENIHKKIKFFDPQISVKKKLVNEKFQYIPGTKMPLPSEVEISESGTCNRKCSFCPRSDPNYIDIKEFIKPALHDKLHKELEELNFSGTVRYSGFVEPLLDKNIYNLLKKARAINQKVNLEMVTNGDVLNPSRLIKLFKSGLNRLFISVYDGPKDIKKFIKIRSKTQLNDKQVVIRDRSFSSKKDFGLTISNRAGMLENAEYTMMPLKKKWNILATIPVILFLWIITEMY